MLSTVRTALVSILFLISSMALGSETMANHEQMADCYFSALMKVFRKGSTEQDIDHLMDLMHPDSLYQHVEYGADFNKKAWREAFLNNLKKGAYQRAPESEIKILNTIAGKSALALEYAYGEKKPGKDWEMTGKPLFLLMEFKDRKISLIREYW